MYKQTVLGPAWIIITPLFGTLVSTFVFGEIAKIPTDGVPYFLFYMCGNVAWNYFATCLTNTSSTFVSNAHVLGKVYFPRLVAPISTVITGLMNFVIQLFMFIVFAVWHLLAGGSSIFGEGMIHPNFWIFALPLLVLQMALLGLGCGIIISSLTTKYRDLKEICDMYRSISDYSLIFTKLDETSAYGNLLNIKLYADADISYMTNGQNVPDDIAVFQSQEIVKKLLGGD